LKPRIILTAFEAATALGLASLLALPVPAAAQSVWGGGGSTTTTSGDQLVGPSGRRANRSGDVSDIREYRTNHGQR
jgi:hypothetical protein